MEREVFISGATGFMGHAVAPVLLARGHNVTALVRPGSEGRVSRSVRPVTVDPFDAASISPHLPAGATFLRPWYVLGPGRRWPLALIPFYRLFERIPATREGALRLGLVTLDDMVASLVYAVENPPQGIEVLDASALRQQRQRATPPTV